MRIARNRPDGRYRYVELITSHRSVESVSRARRALSRAPAMADVIDVPSSVSKASRNSADSRVEPALGDSVPITESRVRQAESMSTAGSSTIIWVCTSRIRAVSSARST